MKDKYKAFDNSYINFEFINFEGAAMMRRDLANVRLIDHWVKSKYPGCNIKFRSFLLIFFSPLILIFFFLLRGFFSFCKIIFTSSVKFATKKIFVNSHLGFNTAISKKLFTESDFMLMYPNLEADIPSASKIYIHQLLTCRMLFRTLKDCFVSFSLFINKNGFSSSFYLFTAYDFYLLYNVLSTLSLDTEIVMANQKDRWATLLDFLPHEHKTIIQHGTNFVYSLPTPQCSPFFKFDAKYECYYLDMPCKLNTISKVYSFTEKEFYFMMKGEYSNTPQAVYIGYCLNISDLGDSEHSALIVGNADFYKKEEDIIIRRLLANDVHVYIKTHPTVPVGVYNSYFALKNVTIVNQNIYPKVKVVFSYSSTLALEYESFGVKVIYYNTLFSDNGEIPNDKIDYIIRDQFSFI